MTVFRFRRGRECRSIWMGFRSRLSNTGPHTTHLQPCTQQHTYMHTAHTASCVCVYVCCPARILRTRTLPLHPCAYLICYARLARSRLWQVYLRMSMPSFCNSDNERRRCRSLQIAYCVVYSGATNVYPFLTGVARIPRGTSCQHAPGLHFL